MLKDSPQSGRRHLQKKSDKRHVSETYREENISNQIEKRVEDLDSTSKRIFKHPINIQKVSLGIREMQINHHHN